MTARELIALLETVDGDTEIHGLEIHQDYWDVVYPARARLRTAQVSKREQFPGGLTENGGSTSTMEVTILEL